MLNEKRNTKIFFIGIIFLIGISYFKTSNTNHVSPTPPKTIVKTNMEDGKTKIIKKKWLDLIHQAGDGIDWREVENRTSKRKYEEKLIAGQSEGLTKSIQGGVITGTWKDIGPVNQSGDIKRVAYSSIQDRLYAISAGHTLWKGKLDGTEWVVVNDDLRFDYEVLEIVESQGEVRIITSINGKPYFSDGGILWSESSEKETELQIDNIEKMFNNELFMLCQVNGAIQLKHSNDKGKTYDEVYTFGSTDLTKVAIQATPNKQSLFVIEHFENHSVKTYRWDAINSSLIEIFTDNTTWEAHTPEKANLFISNNNGSIKLLRNGSSNTFYEAKLGQSNLKWKPVSDLPEKPWWDSFFISKDNPFFMITGRIDSYYTKNGGITWNRINAWQEYYDNPIKKLHADIMQIKEFRSASGQNYIAICTHGGIYLADFTPSNIENDLKNNLKNITAEGLKNAQFYDVVAPPTDPYWIIAGSQDQGWQRYRYRDDSSDDFMYDQVVAGDWGHLLFVNPSGMWASYPGGEIHYYPNVLTMSEGTPPNTMFEINSLQESVWIPPLMKHPNPDFGNSIFVAGGSIKGQEGSHLIQLNNINGQLEFTQMNFNFGISGGEISAMAYDPIEVNRWYVATTNGKFFYTEDGGAHFTMISPQVPNSDDRYGSHILASKVYAGTVYISGSGYSTASILKSTNGGKTWVDFTNGLPNTTVFELATNEDESLIFAATEAGPYVYIANLNEWFDLSAYAAPNQRYWSVFYIDEIKTARFGTFGRGIWDFTVESSVGTNNISHNQSNITIYPNPSSSEIRILNDSDLNIVSYALYSQNGNFIFEEAFDSSKAINIENLLQGINFLKVQTENGHVFKKFIKL